MRDAGTEIIEFEGVGAISEEEAEAFAGVEEGSDAEQRGAAGVFKGKVLSVPVVLFSLPSRETVVL
jgi:hypothetical protein